MVSLEVGQENNITFFLSLDSVDAGVSSRIEPGVQFLSDVTFNQKIYCTCDLMSQH